MNIDVLVVGAGFAGATAAERLANAGRQVLLIDKRGHVAGNAYDEYDAHGLLIHRYGPHIFHTNSSRVWNYLSQFTSWRPYEHQVLAEVDGQLLPIPINQVTINRLYGFDLDEAGTARFLESVREPRAELRTSEDVVLASVGRDLCDKFFRGYTRKQWGVDLHHLSPAVLARIPTRTNRDCRYFSDTYQAMPQDGFTRMFRNLLDHPNITLGLGQDFGQIRQRCQPRLTIFTGPVDEYFGHCFGHLPYRSLEFEHKYLPGVECYQPVAVVNYPNDFNFTRVTEFKHLTGQRCAGTSIVREYPRAEGDPYFPIPCPESAAMHARYQQAAQADKSVVFLGRLGQYRYYNMDQVVAAALTTTDQILGFKQQLMEQTEGLAGAMPGAVNSPESVPPSAARPESVRPEASLQGAL